MNTQLTISIYLSICTNIIWFCFPRHESYIVVNDGWSIMEAFNHGCEEKLNFTPLNSCCVPFHKYQGEYILEFVEP